MFDMLLVCSSCLWSLVLTLSTSVDEEVIIKGSQAVVVLSSLWGVACFLWKCNNNRIMHKPNLFSRLGFICTFKLSPAVSHNPVVITFPPKSTAPQGDESTTTDLKQPLRHHAVVKIGFAQIESEEWRRRHPLCLCSLWQGKSRERRQGVFLKGAKG